jgi:hypothetical protein
LRGVPVQFEWYGKPDLAKPARLVALPKRPPVNELRRRLPGADIGLKRTTQQKLLPKYGATATYVR